MKLIFCIFGFLLAITSNLHSQVFISEKKEPNSFLLCSSDQSTKILVDENDDWLVNKSASLLQNDIETVTGKKPEIISSSSVTTNNMVVIGTINSSIIQQLIKEKKINVEQIKNKWETYLIQSFQYSSSKNDPKSPLRGVGGLLVIVGSDKRGTAYGVFEISKQLGVSPWYWWADVPVKKKNEVYVKKGVYVSNSPSVKYRGIFINDEAPAFSGWTKEKFGGVNHLVYEKMFELLLRLKANYLWPAMWGNAFNDDDTLNPVLANKWGIVMGTSHHEPMLRAQQEWKRYGKGPWDYTKNDTVLRAFWKKGIENMDHHESIVTVGMRGDGDMPMTQGTAIDLLEKIVADQRKIIEEVTGKPASETPQDWALYKEVQDYYAKGMRVPDDVTLLLCDDNWGNVRLLPKLTDKPRKGGYGIYYHFDYVGGPRNYKWINTNNIARVWEQMHLAYEYGVKNIWVVNVGDLKPMEFPISFFLDYAYDTKKWNEDNLKSYYTQWAKEQFGSAHAKEIGDIIREYSQLIARRKPELLDANTYDLHYYDEWSRIVNEWKKLQDQTEKLDKQISSEYKDSYFELVLHPVKTATNLYEMYQAVALNKWFASMNYKNANLWADSVKHCYVADSLLTIQYNKGLANGKWSHMMDQTHIGYTYWQQPPVNKIPQIKYVSDSAKYVETTKGISVMPDIKTLRNGTFYDLNHYVSIEAAHYTKKIDATNIKWKIIPDIGKDGDGITTFPVTAKDQTPGKNSPHLEYEIYTYDTGAVKLMAYFSPTLNFRTDSIGLQFAISIDGEQPQIVSINKEDNNNRIWGDWVSNNIIIKTTNHHINKPGKHVIKYWMVSSAVVLQKIVADLGGVKQSYLGPPETLAK